jgi:hypothetical protein
MDFEWQNGGPKDLSSPFTKLVAKSKEDQSTSHKSGITTPVSEEANIP